MDVSNDTIQNLFFRQIKNQTRKSLGLKALESFDRQFSDHWL